jgi:hypothetical protein
MGTRASILFYINGEFIFRLYTQYDGYNDGVPLDVFKFLNHVKIVNGYNSDQKAPHYANGWQCALAQVITIFKIDIGSIYIEPENSPEQEYMYRVFIQDESKDNFSPGGEVKKKVLIKFTDDNSESVEPTELTLEQYVQAFSKEK